MSGDPQDQAESVDEDQIGGQENSVNSDEVEVQFPPDRPQGIQFADSDVTDESLADRVLREEPEVWEQDQPIRSDDDVAADEQLELIIDLNDPA